MRRFCALVCVVVTMFAACGERSEGPDPAAVAAKTYYDSLIAGNYDSYLSGVAGTDSLPDDYRSQLLANVKHFFAGVREEHGGIDSVGIVRVDTASAGSRRDVFLLLNFTDSVREEIVVPMVETPAGWRMK